MRTQTPTKRVYLLDPNEVDNLALDGTPVLLRAGQQVLKNWHFLPNKQNAVWGYANRVLKKIELERWGSFLAVYKLGFSINRNEIYRYTKFTGTVDLVSTL